MQNETPIAVKAGSVLVAINIYTVQADVEAAGWQLISTTYKNLKTPLDFICPKGHQVSDTYDNWRKHHICEECVKLSNGNVTRNKLPARGKDTRMRVLALDAATGTTGYAIFDDKKLVDYGTFTTNEFANSTGRINELKRWVDSVIEKTCPDAVGVENIQYQKNVKMFQTLANLQGVLLDYLYEKKIDNKLAYSSTWRSYLGICSGEERENAKQQAQNYVRLMYHIKATQDEADAICLGYYFAQQFVPKVATIKKQFEWGDEIL